MNIAQLNALLKDVALGRKSVHEYGEGDVYQNLNSGEHKYAYVNWTINNIQVTENTLIINCYLFYIDRLLEDSSNKLDIWTTGCNTLQQILNAAKNGSEFFDFSNTVFTNFTEKFSDLCAGVYCTCDIEILGNVSECDEEYIYHEGAYDKGFVDGWASGYTDGVHSVPLVETVITQNGVYIPEKGGYNRVEVNISGGTVVSGSTTILENGEYDVADYATAIVEIPTQDYFESGYTSGHSAGVVEGFHDGYSSGHTDGEVEGWSEGWSSGETYGKEIGYASGYSAGVDSVPLTYGEFTSNGNYTAATGGWSAITINVDSGTTPTGTLNIEENGDYNVTNYAQAHVAIPVLDYYNSGYTSGHSAGLIEGYNSGWTAGYESGSTDGYQSGMTAGEEVGYQSGWTVGYNSGWTDAMATSAETYANGYQSGFTDGAASIDTQAYFDSGYTSGYSAGIESVPLTSTAFTANDTYINQNGGWSAVTVNIDTQAYFNSGYTSGYSAGFEDGYESGITIANETPFYFRHVVPTGLFSAATISLECHGNCNPNIEYSRDGQTWTTWDYSEMRVLNSSVYFRGYNPDGFSTSKTDYAKFVATGNLYVGGNIMSLVDGCASILSTTIPSDYCFYSLLSGTTIVNFQYSTLPKLKLPATTLTTGCYESLFAGCTSLVGEISLPAETLTESCYKSLFDGCSSLCSASTYINLYATAVTATNCTTNWLNGTGGVLVIKGKVMNYGNATLTHGVDGIPAGWGEYKMQLVSS